MVHRHLSALLFTLLCSSLVAHLLGALLTLYIVKPYGTPLTQLVCDVSQLQVERQTVLVFICTAAVSWCSTCTSQLPNLSMWYMKDLWTPKVIPEMAVQTDALILALKMRPCRNKLFGWSWSAAGPSSSFQPGWHSLRHQCIGSETPLALVQHIQSLFFPLPLTPLEHILYSS